MAEMWDFGRKLLQQSIILHERGFRHRAVFAFESGGEFSLSTLVPLVSWLDEG
jgi:hypothetical protein